MEEVRGLRDLFAGMRYLPGQVDVVVVGRSRSGSGMSRRDGAG
jgi:hypothetical protein